MNGHLSRDRTRHLLRPAYVPESACDSALLAMFLWQRLDAGEPLEHAMAGLLHEVASLDANACLNMLATDGRQIVATTWAETLCYRTSDDGVLVASEPHDDEPGWVTVPDRHVVVADACGVEVRPAPTAAAGAQLPLAGEPAA